MVVVSHVHGIAQNARDEGDGAEQHLVFLLGGVLLVENVGDEGTEEVHGQLVGECRDFTVDVDALACMRASSSLSACCVMNVMMSYDINSFFRLFSSISSLLTHDIMTFVTHSELWNGASDPASGAGWGCR